MPLPRSIYTCIFWKAWWEVLLSSHPVVPVICIMIHTSFLGILQNKRTKTAWYAKGAFCETWVRPTSCSSDLSVLQKKKRFLIVRKILRKRHVPNVDKSPQIIFSKEATAPPTHNSYITVFKNLITYNIFLKNCHYFLVGSSHWKSSSFISNSFYIQESPRKTETCEIVNEQYIAKCQTTQIPCCIHFWCSFTTERNGWSPWSQRINVLILK